MKKIINTPADIRDLTWFGSFGLDVANFDAVDDYLVKRCPSLQDAKEALAIMGSLGMGYEGDASTVSDQDVREAFEDEAPHLFTLPAAV